MHSQIILLYHTFYNIQGVSKNTPIMVLWWSQLTQNCMDLAYVWVKNISYGPGPPDSPIPEMPHTKLRDPTFLSRLEEGCPDCTSIVHMMAACNTVVPSDLDD